MRMSKSDRERAIYSAKALLSLLYSKAEIKRHLRQLHGLKARAAESIITEAKNRLREATGAPREELQRHAVEACATILRDPKSSRALRLRAVDMICKILGLYQPMAHRHQITADVETRNPKMIEEIVKLGDANSSVASAMESLASAISATPRIDVMDKSATRLDKSIDCPEFLIEDLKRRRFMDKE